MVVVSILQNDTMTPMTNNQNDYLCKKKKRKEGEWGNKVYEMIENNKPSAYVIKKLKRKQDNIEAKKRRLMRVIVKWKPFSSAKITAPTGAPKAQAMADPKPIATILRISDSVVTLLCAILPIPAPICPPIASIGPSLPTAIGLAVTRANPSACAKNCLGPKL